ncbi:hypothetical protein [Halorubellus sp. PRR65]|uniref:DUF7284 family protein n=1 Tax=Halorubellus sp. PRR65 TaxID=3098148 RepID=UPI002B257769|nr:hypothetical protein [Halorubellus sp. PRR65]
MNALASGPPADRSRADRASSTTLDVVLCLLLLSAAVGVLAAATPPPDGHDPRTADRAAALLSTTTVTVDAPGGARAHGTLAALLARAALAGFHVDASDPGADAGDLRTDGSERTTPAGAFERTIGTRTERALASVDASVNVTASYAPLPGSDAAGEATVGPAVPRDVDVSVARVRVPVGTGPNPTERRRAANDDGVRGLARTIADATLATVLAPSPARWTLRDPAMRRTVVSRYRGLGRALDVAPAGALAGGRVQRANALLSRALADRYVAVARASYETPADAADAARPRVVVLTVRTWSP